MNGGENMGSMGLDVGGVGLFQAGFQEQQYNNGKRRDSNHETEDAMDSKATWRL